MRFDQLRAALLTIGVPVAHYTSKAKANKYLVWAEDGQAGGAGADNMPDGQIMTGAVHYFTQDEEDTNVEAVQQALSTAEIAWRLGSIQYEDDTGYTHYEWIWELI